MASIKIIMLLSLVGLCVCEHLLLESNAWPKILYNLEVLKEEQLWNTGLLELDRVPEYSGVGVYNWRRGNKVLAELFNWVYYNYQDEFDNIYYNNFGGQPLGYASYSDYFKYFKSLEEYLAEPEGTFAAILERGTVRVGFDPLYNSEWELSVDDEGNPNGGIWFDIVRFVASVLGSELKVEWVSIPIYYQAIALDDGSVDALVNIPKYGSGYWELLSGDYNFEYTVSPYMQTLGWSLGLEEIRNGIRSWRELNSEEYTVAVASHLTYDYTLMWLGMNLPNATIVTFNDYMAAGYALHTGKVDALFGDQPSLGRLQKQYNRAIYQGAFTPYFPVSIVVRGDNNCEEQCSETQRSI